MSDEFGLSVGTTTDADKLLQPYPALQACIEKGQRLHAFRSGGGLRVVFLADPGKGPCSASQKKNNKAYGEHPHIEAALKLAEEDCVAGGRPYNEVYGKLVQHFLTGTTEASSALDRWILAGNNFDIYFENYEFVFEGEYYYDYPIEKDKQATVVQAYKDYQVARDKWLQTQPKSKERAEYQSQMREAESRQTLVYEQEGITFELTPFVFPGNGTIGCSRKPLKVPQGRDPSFEKRTFRHEGGDSLLHHIKRVTVALARHFDKVDNG